MRLLGLTSANTFSGNENYICVHFVVCWFRVLGRKISLFHEFVHIRVVCIRRLDLYVNYVLVMHTISGCVALLFSRRKIHSTIVERGVKMVNVVSSLVFISIRKNQLLHSVQCPQHFIRKRNKIKTNLKKIESSEKYKFHCILHSCIFHFGEKHILEISLTLTWGENICNDDNDISRSR